MGTGKQWREDTIVNDKGMRRVSWKGYSKLVHNVVLPVRHKISAAAEMLGELPPGVKSRNRTAAGPAESQVLS